MTDINTQKQKLHDLVQQIEKNVLNAQGENSNLQDENAKLRHELGELRERLEVYSYELEAIRKQHANTNN